MAVLGPMYPGTKRSAAGSRLPDRRCSTPELPLGLKKMSHLERQEGVGSREQRSIGSHGPLPGRREQKFRPAKAARADMLKLIDDEPYLYDDTAKTFAARQRRQ